MNGRVRNPRFWERLKKRALTEDLIDNLRESRSLNPFLTKPKKHSMRKIDCANPHTKRALTNAVNRILKTDHHSVLYLHSDKKWEKACQSSQRSNPFIRCGAIRKWQFRNNARPLTLSKITREMTKDLDSHTRNDRVFALCKKHVRNVFKDYLWKSIRVKYKLYFSKLYPHSSTTVKDGFNKIGALVLRNLVFAAAGEDEMFHKYKPMLFALRYGIPIEPHPFQPRYLTCLTR